jgi:HEAT repeat protein
MNSPSPSTPRCRFPWRFGLQTLLVAILLISALLAWWRDHVQLTQRIELQEMRLRSLEASYQAMQPDVVARGGGFFGPMREEELESQFSSAVGYVDYAKAAENTHAVESTFRLLNRAPWADDASALLAEMLKSSDPEQRRRAALAFSEFRTTDDDLVPKLVPLLDDPERKVQRCAVAAIVQHGQAAKDAVPSLQRHAQSLTSPIAVDALLTLDVILLDFSVESMLVKLLDHEDEAVRRQAVRALPNHLDATRAEAILSKMFFRETSAELREDLAEAINAARVSQPTPAGS